MREGILAAAVNHLLGLDVEIRWQDIACSRSRYRLACPMYTSKLLQGSLIFMICTEYVSANV